MRNILTSAPWFDVGSVQVLSVTTERETGINILVRTESGHCVEYPADYEQFQKQKPAEAIGMFFLEHPDAKLVEQNDEFYYTYLSNDQQQRTRLGNSPQQALILAIS